MNYFKSVVATVLVLFTVLFLSAASSFACGYGEGGYGQGGYQTDCGNNPTATPNPTSQPLHEQVVYRFYSPRLRSHFYTASEAEKNHLISAYSDVYRFEGTAYQALTENTVGAIPLYRFYSPRHATHFYTASQTERDYIIAHYPSEVWRYEGVSSYVLPLDDGRSSTVVHRFFNRNRIAHFYTQSEDEKNQVQSQLSEQFRYEGQAYKVAE